MERVSIPSGSRLGAYEVLSPLGAGGMGEVYRARDSKLGRQVAIKVIPEAFARDSDRMARFEREAKVLASLNHPNIATIHGFEDSGSTRALVMELVEGPTLADRIRLGPIPIAEALPIAKQICEALEYAHERGIVHRDLKPANIKVTVDDNVKVLDFGLAKALEGDAASADIATSPTMSRMATMAGILLGTAAYMSPEQAKAKPVDRRADIWAFGCVLYEMLTGKMAFRGDTVTDTLAAVIKDEPDWSKLPVATPVRVRVLLQRCLQKEPKQRLQAIGDARIALEEVISGAPDPVSASASQSLAAVRKSSRLWIVFGIAVPVMLAAALFLFMRFREKPPSAEIMRYDIPLPDKIVPSGNFALSPDGRKLAFIARGPDGQSRIWIRSVENLEARSLDGTEGVAGLFWSPDSHYLGFAALPGKLKKVESVGGPPLTICDVSSYFGGAWNSADQIIFGTGDGLKLVAVSGGLPTPLTDVGNDGNPAFLPDGRHFIYTRIGPRLDETGIYVGSLDDKPQGAPHQKLLADYSAGRFVSSSSDGNSGYLLFVRGSSAAGSPGTLMAQPFDSRRLELKGEAVLVADQVSNLGFSASATDTLVLLSGAQGGTAGAVRGVIDGQLTWFDRQGKILGSFGDPGSYRTLALSPDGKHVAFDRGDNQNPTVRNLWLYEFARGTTTRFTFDSGLDFDPVWSPDSSRIAFTSAKNGQFDLFQKASNLAAEDELLYRSSDPKAPSSWSPDGNLLLYFNPLPPSRQWLLPIAGDASTRKPIRVDNSDFQEAAGRISPNGRWLAYTSDESGRQEVYVRPFDPAGAAAPATGKWMVSKDGGTTVLWRADGKELFYLSGVGGTAMAVDVTTAGLFQAGIPRPLFKAPSGVLFWDVSADGKRFVMAAPSTEATAPKPRFTIVLNWQSALKK
jgi:eukaryotic-like serine/threonine-protein kinase